MISPRLFGCDYLKTTRVKMVCVVLCITSRFCGLFSHFNKEAEVNELTNEINKKWWKYPVVLTDWPSHWYFWAAGVRWVLNIFQYIHFSHQLHVILWWYRIYIMAPCKPLRLRSDVVPISSMTRIGTWQSILVWSSCVYHCRLAQLYELIS